MNFNRYMPYVGLAISLATLIVLYLAFKRDEEKHALDMALQHKQLEALIRQEKNGNL